jgi:hypothetical protein
MSAGLEIYNKDGSTMFSTTDTTWNFVASFEVHKNQQSVNKYFSSVDVSEFLVIRHMVDQAVGDDEAYAHEYYWQSTILKITRPSSGNTVNTHFTVMGR